ncbi:MAG: U32 family peptidase [Rhodospirillales bacterium RIFCSPLOWO2_12_FULL_58_28]|nr:MAG: U32 family peptidase [Rhodospirillales bacterium RIFCSPLOWO2_02_FULL_58_16]OHC79378.1 MAG: U32 family peptidase [Rhodospirillales bacterium RIFCSPLOWO2_12_FULL_58_28]
MSAKLTLGPLFFNWAPEKQRDFYFRIADEACIDSVCIGEVVCSKRTPFFEPYIAEVIERLEAAGKEVVHSTPALIMTEREMAAVRDIAACDEFFVEANDIAVCALLGGRRHAIGPFINIYNEDTLEYLTKGGAQRICLPPELPAASLAVLAKAAAAELEVMVFGRLPLAVSARCYHARAHNLTKDNCRYVCGEDADGMEIDTLDGAPFLAVNGTQTLSYAYCNLAGRMAEMREMGINRFRLSPHDVDMATVAQIFRNVLDGRESSADAGSRLKELMENALFCDGYFHNREGASSGAD